MFQTVEYQCKYGMKFSGDFSKPKTETTCREATNDYETITETCVPSKLQNQSTSILRNQYVDMSFLCPISRPKTSFLCD